MDRVARAPREPGVTLLRSVRSRPLHRNFLAGLLAASVGFLGGVGGTASAAASAAQRIVDYHGYRVTVPAAWPVFDLAQHPSVCVRFDRHALYLGNPSPHARCPAHAVGRTEAILVQPPARGDSAKVSVTATWLHHRSTVRRALPGRSLASAKVNRVDVARAADPSRKAAPARRSSIYTGPGFDTCAAPSASAMTAWSASPYRAVGIYIGGENRACAQANLSAAWVSARVAAGWHLIPTYVGLQAPGACSGCKAIDPNKPAAQGAAAANAAADQAQALGIPPGNPIYYDMEAYARGGSRTSTVLAFLSAWTSQLHALGYISGVYSSASSGISDLVDSVGSKTVEPDDIWIADWNGKQTTDDPYVPAGYWPNSQRIHQYAGGHNETHGGVTLNIDGDYAAGATADTTAGSAPTGPGEVTARAHDHSASVSFTPAPSDATNPITGYTVTSSPGAITATGLTSPIKVRGLANGTTYTFTVTATYASGASSTSNLSNPVTPHARDAVCVVPQLKGLTIAQARDALHLSKCRLGQVSRPGHRLHHRILRITRQRPHPGKRLAKHAPVNVTAKWRRK